MVSPSFRRCLPALIGALALSASPLSSLADGLHDHGGEKKKEAEVSISISGRVVDAATGEPVAGATVSTMELSAKSDREGRFLLADVPSTHQAAVNYRVMNEAGRIIGCASVPVDVTLQPIAAQEGDRFAVAVVDISSDVKNLELKVVSSRGAAASEACAACHKPNPCLLDPAETIDWAKVTHLGGLVVQQKDFEETKAKLLAKGVSADMYPNLRYQDAHPQGVSVAEKISATPEGQKASFRLPEKLPLGEGGKLICDTCHTRHLPTEFQLFLRQDIVGSTLLCRECHI